jgi:hypothetical protein
VNGPPRSGAKTKSEADWRPEARAPLSAEKSFFNLSCATTDQLGDEGKRSMRITYTYTCSLCGFSGDAQEVSPGHLIAKKRSLAQSDTCKLADEMY